MSNEAVKLISVGADNFMRLRTVEMDLKPNGLTVIGGKNAQGKTSVLRAIAWLLGGQRKSPAKPTRDGADECRLNVELDNGVKVERHGKDGIKISGPFTGGQQLLNAFTSKFAIDLPRLLDAQGAERTKALLDILGTGPALAKIENKYKALYGERQQLYGRKIASAAHAEKMPYHSDIVEYDIDSIHQLLRKARTASDNRTRGEQKVAHLEQTIEQLSAQLVQAKSELEKCKTALAGLPAAVDMTGLEAQLEAAATAKQYADANRAKECAEAESQQLDAEYGKLTGEIDKLVEERKRLLDGCGSLLEGLSIQSGEITYRGQMWSDLSHAEQIRVGTAIVRADNPDCGFVLIDKLEALDADSLKELHNWAVKEDLQIIATRVSTGDECTVILEDGGLATEVPAPAETTQPEIALEDF